MKVRDGNDTASSKAKHNAQLTAYGNTSISPQFYVENNFRVLLLPMWGGGVAQWQYEGRKKKSWDAKSRTCSVGGGKGSTVHRDVRAHNYILASGKD